MDCPNFSSQKAQTLVVVLVVLVIAAVVTTAVAYRAIQDIKLTTEERNSAIAAIQIDSLLDIAMEEDFWGALWVDDVDGCGDVGTEYTACRINNTFWDNYISSDIKCDDWSVFARRSSLGIESFFLGKDEVIEIDLREEDGTGRPLETLGISWKGDSDYLILKFYNDGVISDDIALTYEDSENWDFPDSGDVETLPALGDSYESVIGSFDIVRIRAVGGDALLSVSGLASGYYQFGELKAYCYIGDVYREYISQFTLRSSSPSAFDYVLFDSTGVIGGAALE